MMEPNDGGYIIVYCHTGTSCEPPLPEIPAVSLSETVPKEPLAAMRGSLFILEAEYIIVYCRAAYKGKGSGLPNIPPVSRSETAPEEPLGWPRGLHHYKENFCSV